MKLVHINEKFDLVCQDAGIRADIYFEGEGFLPGPAIRRRDGNPYAPENLKPRWVIGAPGIRTEGGCTQAEFDAACTAIEADDALHLMGPYIV